ncbi:MAG: 16S rRNA (guanine(966)-N(2))-methyltransferase RsmD [Clostridia bacterium]|nr:16S rRNA (guanine(966)-N(2))-methyltransferase RsmD [Clostridia bacterium]
MRIISGKARGTKLYTLEGIKTRPTLDRVKEPLFSIITAKLLDAEVLDLFAGSGALGIEALSRGAKNVILCDNSKDAIDVINKNLEKTRLNAQVVNSDYEKCLSSLKSNKFDLIFLDPPYKTDYIERAINKILEYDILKKDGLIIAETDNQDKIEKIKNLNIEIKDIRKYGRAILIFLNRKG